MTGAEMSRPPHLDINRPVNCEDDCRNAKCLDHSQADEKEPSERVANESEVSKDEQPVVDGELHDGVVVDAGPEDPPPLLLYPLLFLLCG